jgi:hypothetical protein
MRDTKNQHNVRQMGEYAAKPHLPVSVYIFLDFTIIQNTWIDRSKKSRQTQKQICVRVKFLPYNIQQVTTEKI